MRAALGLGARFAGGRVWSSVVRTGWLPGKAYWFKCAQKQKQKKTVGVPAVENEGRTAVVRGKAADGFR